MAPGPVNRHRGLRKGELTQRYRRRHERVEIEDPDDRHDLYVDDWWDPRDGATPLDFELHRIWGGILSSSYKPPLGALLPAEIIGARPPAPASEVGAITADRLADALYDRLQLVTAQEARQQCLEKALDDPFGLVRSAGTRVPELLRWFHRHQGPGIMLLVLSPFWIRPLDTWAPPTAADADRITDSLIEHVFVRYQVPAALYRPWRSTSLPSLKWASWLVLIGQGASLHRVAPRFGWRISSKFVNHLLTAPPHLEPIEAAMWAEIMRLGGSRREFDRIYRQPAYVIDPTAITSEPDRLALDVDETPGDQELDHESHRFWQSTVGWLVRHRDELTDEACERVLDWAIHRHTEDLARDIAHLDRFSWRGRAVAPTLEQAEEYWRLAGRRWPRRGPWLRWRRRGWDWEHRDGDRSWSMRELTSEDELVAESLELHHCVASYVHACAQGRSAIFSVSLDGARRLTVELDPASRRIVQARGNRNRACDSDERELLRRWLDALTAANPPSAPPDA